MSRNHNYNELGAVLESIAMLNENHVANKIAFAAASRAINSGNSVIGGVEYENHYIGGYHYFKRAE